MNGSQKKVVYSKNVARNIKRLRKKCASLVLRDNMFSATTIETPSNTWKQIYATGSCASYQCDSSNAFYLDVFGDKLQMDICALISFKKKLADINIESLLLDSHSAALEIVHLTCIDKLFVFSIDEILQMRDLIDGTFAMLHLNSILHQSIHRPSLV